MSGNERFLNPAILRVEKLCEAWHPRRFVSAFLTNLTYPISRIFSCWHRRMSRPFTRAGETYRVCLRCGMHRQFDLDAWRTTGAYYNGKLSTEKSGQRAASASRKLRLIA